LALTAPFLTPCHPPPASVLSFARVALFFLAAALVKEKTSRHRQKGKNMKLEEVNLKPKKPWIIWCNR